MNLIENLGSEFDILLFKTKKEISKFVSDKNISQAIMNMRNGKVKVSPGYDGEFGKVEVMPDGMKSAPKQRALL